MDPKSFSMLGMVAGSQAVDIAMNIDSNDMRLSAHLPKVKKRVSSGDNDLEILEKWGIVFGKDVDDILVEAKLPNGWKKVGTNHHMYSHLLDDKGQVRAQIMYRGTYDRDGWTSPRLRLGVGSYQTSYIVRTAMSHPVVEDSNKNVLWLGQPNCSDRDLCRQVSLAVLEKHCPNWRDYHAYWDVPNDQLGLPPSEVVLPKMENYILKTDLYDREGRFVDGGQDSVGDFESDEKVIDAVIAHLQRAHGGHYETRYSIFCGSRRVHSGLIPLPRPRIVRGRSIGDHPYFDANGRLYSDEW